MSDKTLYSTFARTSPTARKSIKSVVALMKEFKWNFVSIIFAERSAQRTVAHLLKETLTANDIKVQDFENFPVMLPAAIVETENDTVQRIIEEIVNRTSERTRSKGYEQYVKYRLYSMKGIILNKVFLL